MTVTHDEYLALNGLARDGYKPQRKIEQFDLLRSRRWVQPVRDLEWAINEEVDWELSSSGRLEHNLYERIMRYSDGHKQKRSGCPRCDDSDPMCPICLGYKTK